MTARRSLCADLCYVFDSMTLFAVCVCLCVCVSACGDFSVSCLSVLRCLVPIVLSLFLFADHCQPLLIILLIIVPHLPHVCAFVDTMTWSEVFPSDADKAPMARGGHTVCAHNSRLYVFGGGR